MSFIVTGKKKPFIVHNFCAIIKVCNQNNRNILVKISSIKRICAFVLGNKTLSQVFVCVKTKTKTLNTFDKLEYV